MLVCMTDLSRWSGRPANALLCAVARWRMAAAAAPVKMDTVAKNLADASKKVQRLGNGASHANPGGSNSGPKKSGITKQTAKGGKNSEQEKVESKLKELGADNSNIRVQSDDENDDREEL